MEWQDVLLDARAIRMLLVFVSSRWQWQMPKSICEGPPLLCWATPIATRCFALLSLQLLPMRQQSR